MTSFNLETVRGAWSEKQRAERAAWRAARLMEDGSYATPEVSYPYSWCKEVWSDFIIVEIEGRGKGSFQKIPFSVGADQVVTFGTPKAVKQEYVALSAPTSTLIWKYDEPETPVDRLVALAGTEHVKSYKRTSKTGKVVDVEAYFRSPGKMKNPELNEALKALMPASKSSDTNEANRAKNQIAAIQSEKRKRGMGTSLDEHTDEGLDKRINDLQNDPRVNTGPDTPVNRHQTHLKRLVQEKKNRKIKEQDAEAEANGTNTPEAMQSLLDKLTAAGKGDAQAKKVSANHDSTLVENLKKSLTDTSNISDVEAHKKQVLANVDAHEKDGKITSEEAAELRKMAEALKGAKKVGLSNVFGEDSAIVRLTRKM